MCFGHMCNMASGLWGHLDSNISSSSWNEKDNFNFSNQEFSLPQDDLKGTQVSSNPHANSHVSI